MGRFARQLRKRAAKQSPLSRRARRIRYSQAEEDDGAVDTGPRLSLAEFVRGAWPHVEGDELEWNWHHQVLCDTLERFAANSPDRLDEDGNEVEQLDEDGNPIELPPLLRNERGGLVMRLCINIAPGTAKSLIASVFYPTWRLSQDPTYSVITAANAMPLAIRDTLKANQLVKSEWFQSRWGRAVQLSRRVDAKTHWATTRGGFRKATSTGSSFTGWRAHEIIIDDILDAWDRFSKKKRDKALEWLLTKMTSRVKSDKRGKILIIGQRLHAQDPYGRKKDDRVPGGGLQHRAEWSHLIIPMRMTPRRHKAADVAYTDPRKPGEFLHPSRFSEPEWQRAGSDLGTAQRDAQLQQATHEHVGTVYKRTWWKRYSRLPHSSPDAIFTTWDASFGGQDSEHAFVAGLVFAQYGNDLYLVDMYRRRSEFVETYKAINHMHAKWSPSANLVEDAVNGKAIIQFFKRTDGMAPIIAIAVAGKAKEVRWHASAPIVESGRIHLPADELEGVLGRRFWREEDTDEPANPDMPESFDAGILIDEASDVPDGETCDTVDAFAQLVIWRFLRHGEAQVGPRVR